jgi:DNA-binding SARP family transcriptional activator/tetratricopeptide (TPR) repeat protein
MTGTSDTEAAPAPATLTIRLLDGFSVVVGGTVLRDADLANRRARTLLKLLAVEHGHRVSIDRVIDVLWDDEPPRRAADNVAVLVSRLRRVLGAETVVGGRGGYRLAAEPLVRVDVTQAERLVGEAEARLAGNEAGLASAAAAAALDLLGDGVALAEDDDLAWVAPLRTQVSTLLGRARHAAADAALRTGDFRVGQAAAEAALVADEFDEVAARQLMQTHVRTGEPARALAVYEALRSALADLLGVEPAAETRELHLAVLREQQVELEPLVATAGPAVSGSGLVGRDREIEALTRGWSQAVDGQPTLVLVAGEAGIGKTRLLTELATVVETTGGAVLRARCYETERSLFLQPVVEALDPAVAAMSAAALHDVADGRAGPLAMLFPRISPLLGGAQRDRGTAESERRLAFETVAALLRRLAGQQPLLLVLDDVQHAGLATVELLHYLARHAREGRLLVVAALRSDEGAETLRRLSEVAQRVNLGPLDEDAVARLAERAGLADQAAHIMAGTRGHPLFVVETIRGLASGESGIPETLRAAILQRVERVGERADRLLRAAAVLGVSFEPALVAGLLQLPVPEAARQCELLLESRLVVVAGRSYEFAHDLVHDVLYATTPEPTRLSYHRAAADLLVDRPEAVAAHAAASEDWPRAARSGLLAAERAVERYAAADAERLLTNALAAAESANDLELRARIHVARGRVREVLAAYRDAERDLWAGARLARDAGDARLEMRALRGLGGDVTVALGRPIEQCITLLDDALRIAGLLADRASEADVLARLAVLACNELRFDESIDLGDRAVAAAGSANDDHALAVALDGLKASLAYLGDVERLATVMGTLEPLLRRTGDLFLLQWAVFESSFIPFARGDWRRADELVREALELNRRSGHAAYEGWFHAHLGWIARLEGRHADAVEHGRHSLVRVGDQPHSWWNTFNRAMLATTLTETGDATAEATALLEEGLRFAERGGTPAYRLRCLALLARVTGSRELLADADATLATVSAPPGRAWLHGIDVYVAVAGAHLDHDSPEAAAHVIEPVVAAARSSRSVSALAQALLVDARCASARGDTRRARAAAGEAETLAGRYGMRHLADLARTQHPAL